MNSTEETKDRSPEGPHGHHPCHRRGWRKMILIPIFVIAVVALKSAVVMLLWNALVPDLFHGPEVTYLQALGLTVLAKLFTGFGGGWKHRGHGPWGRRRWGHGGPWGNMTREEREKLRDELRERFGHRGHGGRGGRGPGAGDEGAPV